MDPNEALRSLRVYARNRDSMDSLSEGTVREVLDTVLRLFSVLDERLSDHNGFMPDDWR